MVFLQFFAGHQHLVLEPVTSAGDGDGLGVVQEAVQDGRGAGHIAQELAPFFDGSVAGHDRRAVFITAHDDFQQVFGAVFGQAFESHVINDDQFGFEIFANGAFLLAEGFVFEKVMHQVEDGTVKDFKVHLDGFVADGLGQVSFAHTRRPDEKHIGGFADEGAGGQFVNLFAVDGGIELPVELLQGFQMPEVSGFGAPFEHSLLAHGQFILEDEFQKIRVVQTVGCRFLEPDWLIRDLSHYQALIPDALVGVLVWSEGSKAVRDERLVVA